MPDLSAEIDRLKEQVKQLQGTLDNIGAYVFTKDINGRYTFANEMVCKLFQTPLEEIIGSTDDKFFDLAGSDELVKHDRRVIENGEHIESEETDYVKSTGEKRIFWTVKTPLYGTSGEINGMCGISTDITGRLRMEKELKDINLLLQSILDNAPSLIYMKDSDLRYTYVNSNFAGLFGLMPEEILNKRDADFMPDDIASHINESDREVLKTGARVSGEEVLYSREGDPNYYYYLKIPLQSNNTTNALVGIAYDITDLTLLRRQLEDQNEELRIILDQKNLFLGTVIHDLRNPIGAILGISDILTERLEGELKNLAQLISEASSGMLDLVNNLLDISEIEGGKLILSKTRIDYVSLVTRNILMNEFLAQKKNILIVKEFEVAEQIVNIDKGKIDQVLNNLISNAVKYSNPGTTVTVRIFVDNRLLITQVTDQGQGIPQNEISGIFQYFRKTSTRPTGNEKSHGLGLAIVRKIVEGHHGEITVESEPGKGSTFQFYLPIL